ncbi:MAG: hypothetical protein PHO86_01030 [Bacilli bacterium]|nr:hypothetical protein [Bacilli bacterium]
MKKILLTAFEPFGSLNSNSSLAVLNKISDSESLIKKILPVSYKKCEIIIKEMLLNYKPDVLLLMGQAQNRTKIALEQIAINIINSPTYDNDGNCYLNKRIVEEESDGSFNTIDAINIVSSLESKYPLYLSYSAGTYVCNFSFFIALNLVKKMNLTTKVGFIHFPLYKGQTDDSMNCIDLDVMSETLEKVLEEIKKAPF